MQILIKIFLFCILSVTAHAATPVIYFSDLTSGPNTGGQNNQGVFVTIWGNNFGASQGGSYITIGGGQANNYPVWTNSKVSFQIGSVAATGTIAITTSAGTSNGIPFTVRSGNIYFVNPSAGSNGTGTYASPFNHMWYSFNIQAAGDTTYIETGTISAEVDGCAGWHSVMCENKSGTAASPVAWVAYPGQTVTLSADGTAPTWSQGSSGSGGETQMAYIFRSNGGTYITVSQLNLRFTGTSANLDQLVAGGGGWRIVGNDISATVYTYGCIDVGSGSLGMEVLGNIIHDSGSGYSSTQNQSHSIYIDGPNNPFEVAWNHMYNNQKIGWEISNYHNGPRIGTIHDNLIEESIGSGNDKGILVDGAGDWTVPCASNPGTPDTCTTTYTNNVKAYNNIISNGGTQFGGGAMQMVCGTNTVYNNTLYLDGTETYGVVQVVDYSCGPGGGNEVVYMADNIIWNGTSGQPYIGNNAGGAPNWSDFALLTNNNYYGQGNGPSQDASPINANPLLVSPSTSLGGNYQLQASSPNINAGYNTNSVVAADYNGVIRSSTPSVGAYEYSTCSSNGTSCSSGSTCCSSLCQASQCVSCLSNGGVCSLNSDCCSNYCSASTCGNVPTSGGNKQISGKYNVTGSYNLQ